MNTVQAVVLVVVLIASVVVHEVAHAWQARREGDDTADRLGRITLNPLPHLDPIGSVIIPFLLAMSGGIIFGWAKPVPVNPANYRDYVWGDIRVSMAGIVSNLILAVLSTLGLAVVVKIGSLAGPLGGAVQVAGQAFYFGISINLILAFFNLIPIPPLDGSHVVKHLLPRGLRKAYEGVGQFGILILLALLWVVPQGFAVISTPVFFVTDLLFTVFGLNGRV
jgi:Zn-dependent protease